MRCRLSFFVQDNLQEAIEDMQFALAYGASIGLEVTEFMTFQELTYWFVKMKDVKEAEKESFEEKMNSG